MIHVHQLAISTSGIVNPSKLIRRDDTPPDSTALPNDGSSNRYAFFPPIVSHPRASPLHRLVSSTILPLQPRIAAIYLEGDEGERKRDEDRETYFKTFGRISPISLSLSLFRWIIDSRDGNLIGGRLQPRNSFVSTAHKPD